MAEELHLALLGDIQVRLAGVPIAHFHSRKVLALLCYLAVTGRPHERPALAGLLWGELPEVNARANLRTSLTHLRRLVGSHLDITHHTVAFARESPYWLDVEVLEDACTAGDIERLEGAVELYRGDFMEGFYVQEAPAFEEWMLAQQARLREEATRALHTLAVHHARRGEAGRAAAIEYTTHLLALEPWREEAHRQLMLLLAASGQRGAALAQYEECRRVLATELGVEPSLETRRLYERIRSESALTIGSALSPHNLPAQLTPFVGREALLSEIMELLHDPACRLLTFVGPGGSGKTRLALETAARQLDHYRDGVFFVRLAPLQSTSAIVPTVAQAIGFSLPSGGDARGGLLSYLQRKEMLLVLDNYEHLIDGAEPGQRDGVSFAVGLLRAAPGVKILVTSRARLSALGEQIVPVRGMDLPPLGPQEAEQHEGVWDALQLFLATARRADPGFDLTTDNRSHVTRICHLVHGMPLGIVLSASWVTMLAPAEIERELERQGVGGGLDFLAADLHDVPARQRSMRTVFDHSWTLLPARERDAIQALSVFRGGFTREAALQVAGASLRDLSSLVDRSLLDRSLTPSTPQPSVSRETAGRFEIHELLRQYAAERLCLASTVAASERDESVEAPPSRSCTNIPGRQCVAEGERHCAAVRDRHCAHYLAALARWEEDLKSARQQTALAELDLEIDNVRAAWAWATERRRIADLVRAAEGMSLYCELRLLHTEGAAIFQAAADAIQHMYRPGKARSVDGMSVDELHALAGMRMWQAMSALRGQRIEVASRLLLESLDLLDRPELAKHDTRLERGILLFMLAQSRFEVHREETRQQLERSLPLLRAMDDRWWAGRVLTHLGIVAWDSGDFRGAREYLAESLAAFRAQGDPRRSAEALAYASLVDTWQGHVEQAEQLARESLALLETTGVRAGIAGATEAVAQAVRQAGKFVEAEALMERCLVIWNDLGTRLNSTMQVLARAKMHLGQYERASALAHEELALFRQRDLRRVVGIYLGVLGMAALPAGEYRDAYSWLQEALGIFEVFAMRGEQARTEPVAGLAAQKMGQPDRAREHLVKALRLGRELDSWPPVALALPAIALLLADDGQMARAVELYALASRFPYVANSRWFEDVAGREVRALAATLPREAVAPAQDRGRDRDLWATVEILLAELSARESGGGQ